MRAHEFLTEYSREKTAINYGEKLFNRFISDGAREIIGGGELLNLYDIIDGDDDELKQQKIKEINDIALDKIEKFDPTNHKEYVQWIVKNYVIGSIKRFEDLGRVQVALTRFNDLKKRKKLNPEHRDINRLNFDQLQTILETDYAQESEQSSKENQRQLSARMKKESELYYEDDTVTVIVPKTETASCYYGQGTRWCTASTDSYNYFDRYNRDGKLYILIPKNPKFEGEKYQLHFATGQYMDENDDPVNLMTLFQLFPGAFDKLKQDEPELRNMLIFADDDLIQSLMDSIKSLVEQRMWVTLSDMESDDDYYREYIVSNYSEPIESSLDDETGEYDEYDIDWDAVSKNKDDYLNYNDDIKEEHDEIMEILNSSPEQIKTAAGDPDITEIETPTIRELESIIHDMIHHATERNRYNRYGRTQFARYVLDYLNDSIAVREQGDKNGNSVWSIMRKTTVSQKYPDDHEKAGQYYIYDTWVKVE